MKEFWKYALNYGFGILVWMTSYVIVMLWIWLLFIVEPEFIIEYQEIKGSEWGTVAFVILTLPAVIYVYKRLMYLCHRIKDWYSDLGDGE